MKVIRTRLLLILAVSLVILAGYGCSEEELIEPDPPVDPVWERIQGIESGAVSDMQFDSQDNLFVLLDSDRKWLYHSPDYGNTWAVTDSVSIDTTYTGRISSFCFHGDNLLAGTREGKLFISDDGGNTFNLLDSIGSSQMMDIRHMATAPNGNIYAAVYGHAIYRSEDGGQSWESSGSSIENKDFTSIEVDSNGRIYLGCWAGDSYRSTDNAQTWEPLEKIEDYELATITSMEKEGNDLLVCGFTEGFAIYRGDSNWVIKNAGFPGGNSDLRCMGLTSDGTLYVGTIYDGVYRTNWDEWVWRPVNDGLALMELKIISLAIDMNDRIYIGTVDNGIWHSIW
ncbi:MAG: hypothetical protein GF417_04750 [Candidatus Latescibacteria bacterium]|nr:hypothetical protein [bacterium]MBD3423730.1 hypothetical protein [Candidatus Latescibacterota bacterium]